jgi:hypothetical protein
MLVVIALVAGSGIGSQVVPLNGNPSKINAFVNRSFTDSRVNLPDDCSGRTDYPHKSKHNPGRVNVVAETVCPGQKVEIRTTLTRPGWLIFTETVTQSRSGFGRVRHSVSMPCKWKPGQSPIGYIVMSVHSSANGASAITRVYRSVKC